MNDREKRLVLKEAARWRRVAKHSADRLERLKFFSVQLVQKLEPLKTLPMLSDLYRLALRWDCRTGDYLADLNAEIAAAMKHSRKHEDPPAQFRLLPA
jgi:hypothetical protein